MADIFISYAHEDISMAQRLATALEAQGWSLFWDRHIPAGRRFDEFIHEQLVAAHCVIVLWSAASVESEWAIEEATDAKDRSVLVLALIGNVRPPFGFRHRQWADLLDWHPEASHPGFEQLVKDIVGLCGLPQKSPREDTKRKVEEEEQKRPDQVEPEAKKWTQEQDHPTEELARGEARQELHGLGDEAPGIGSNLLRRIMLTGLSLFCFVSLEASCFLGHGERTKRPRLARGYWMSPRSHL